MNNIHVYMNINTTEALMVIKKYLHIYNQNWTEHDRYTTCVQIQHKYLIIEQIFPEKISTPPISVTRTNTPGNQLHMLNTTRMNTPLVDYKITNRNRNITIIWKIKHISLCWTHMGYIYVVNIQKRVQILRLNPNTQILRYCFLGKFIIIYHIS